MTKTKFRANIELTDGTQIMVLPRSKKSSLFTTQEAAFRAIDRKSRAMRTAYRGHVREYVCGTGEEVSWATMAL